MHAVEIVKYAISAPSADNSQPWSFSVDRGTLICSYSHRTSVPDPFGPLGHANLISSGALLENLRVLVGPDTHQPEWISTESSWQILLEKIDEIPAPSTETAHRLTGRHTNRHPFCQLSTSELDHISASLTDRSVIVTNSDKIRRIAHAVMQCSTARFHCRELHNWLFSSLRWTPDEVDDGSGLDINTLHLPPGGRLFMRWISPWRRMNILNRFGVGHLMATADAMLLREAPGIVAIIGGNSPPEIVESGRIMQSLWMNLNDQGIAVHPYYVLTDQFTRRLAGSLDSRWHKTIDNAVATVNEILGVAPGERIHMLLRVGKPTCSPVRSKRLPVSAFFDA